MTGLEAYEMDRMDAAMAQCKRFMERAEQYRRSRTGRNHASAIRASMDATYALADLRRARQDWWQNRRAEA